ncbi:MAG TPA: FkbM family methyltransferase [Acetobacteraceae bacterium]|nr:FkbM family methyltransferase [Acetobacteraceae bacterium]
MTFVSHAQNFEDVMLWRALRGVPRGFYIDVGAADPDVISVTRAFYERGWRGVNVEPVEAFFQRLQAARPEDVNLQTALAERSGERVLHLVGAERDAGLSTLDPDIARRHADAGWSLAVTTVPVTTLAELCRRHAPGDIHFLKIDVEGAEAAVLAGADFAAYRPWIVLVEAVWPNTLEESHAAWEPLLLGADYRFVWFDGLNRFYVAAERHAALAPAFRLPPNWSDGFRLTDPATEARIAGLEAELARLQRLADARGAEVIELAARAARIDRLANELRWDDGPRLVRAVLPVARAARRVRYGRLRPVPVPALPPPEPLPALGADGLEAAVAAIIRSQERLADRIEDRLHTRHDRLAGQLADQTRVIEQVGDRLEDRLHARIDELRGGLNATTGTSPALRDLLNSIEGVLLTLAVERSRDG